MPAHPTGTVTFLFTDIEGSTRLWETHRSEMEDAVQRHDQLLRSAIASHHGYVFSTAGDAFAASFARADEGVSAAIQAQEAVTGWNWPDSVRIRVRMGLHSGEAQERGGDYFGPVLNECARLMSAANGGQIVLSSLTAELVRARLDPPYRLRDLGEHRLKDLSRGMRLFGLSGGRLPDVRRPLRTIDGMPGNLPSMLPPFIGRESELAELAALVREYRLVTITGMGGIGKTRTAIEAAADAASMFPGGIWLVDLAPESASTDLAGAVSRALGVTSEAGESQIEAVADTLRFRPTLMLLDNCEHVTDAAVALATRLLERCPELRTIATSREPLHTQVERVFPLGPLKIGGTVGSPSEAASLFIERASSEGATIEALEAKRQTIEELCARLDGLPLAIELAAARARSIDPARLLALMTDRFRILKAGHRSDTARHETLQAAIDWSYLLLDTPQRLFFRRLAVFAGPFDASDAAAVAGEDSGDEIDALDSLSYLVDRSFVVPPSDAIPAYRLLETVRAYAMEQSAAAGEIEAIRRRHAEHFATKAAAARQSIVASEHVVTLDLMVLQTAEYRAATAWALAAGDMDLAVRVATGFCGSSYFRIGYEALGWLGSIGADEAVADNALASELLGLLSRRAIYSGDVEGGSALARQSIERDAGAPSVQARGQLALSASARGDPAAIEWAQSAVAVATASGDYLGMLLGDLLLGGMLARWQRRSEAIAVAEDLFRLAAERRSEHARGWGHWVMGVALSTTNRDESEGHIETAWRLGRQEKNRYLESNALVARLEAHLALDSPAEAASAALETLGFLDESADNGYFTRIVLARIQALLAQHGSPAAAAQISGYLAQFGPIQVDARVRGPLEAALGELAASLGPSEFERLRLAGSRLTAEGAIGVVSASLEEIRAHESRAAQHS
jgi:predicted ATPase/class 3 adenylate cyclase